MYVRQTEPIQSAKEAIRARVRRSIDDPRPSLTEEEVDARLNQLFDARAENGGA